MLESAGCVSQRQGMYAGRSVLVPFIIFVLICGFGGFPTKAEIRGGWSLRHQPFSLLTRQETGEKKLGTGQELLLQPSIMPLYHESIKRPGQTLMMTVSGNVITDIPWGVLYLPSIFFFNQIGLVTIACLWHWG